MKKILGIIMVVLILFCITSIVCATNIVNQDNTTTISGNIVTYKGETYTFETEEKAVEYFEICK